MARVLLSIPEEILKEVDNMAKLENRSRSELLRQAFREYSFKYTLLNNRTANQNASILEDLLS